jgi:hypothetical protein
VIGAYDVDTPRHQDFIDVTIRSEIMNSVQGAPAMMQHRVSKRIWGIHGAILFNSRSFFAGPIRSITVRSICDLSMALFGDICFGTPQMQLPLLPCYAMTDDGEH